MNFKTQKFLVAGLSRSGIAAADLLLARGAAVYLYDDRPAALESKQALALRAAGARAVSGGEEGVRACVLDAVAQIQGQGCAPGVLGVCVGADRAEGFAVAKRQLLRPLGDHAPEPELAALEARLLEEANTLGVGPMGLGGKTTLLGVKLAARTRLPASYFVTIAYCCWACRRRGVRLEGWHEND